MAKTPPEDYVSTLKRQGFVLQSAIGAGASGNVYRAEQPSLGRTVAVKFYDSPYSKGEAARKRFDREARLVARVQHPAVPFAITTGVVPSSGKPIPYMVMEFIEGVPLSKRIAQGRALSTTEVYRVMRNVLSALDHAHTCDVIHRDVKPSNILLTPQGAYLIDFSIGVCLAEVPGLTRATSAGTAVGTVDYAAPEQLENAEQVDKRADIYSAGVVFAEMLGARARLRPERLDQELAAVPLPIRSVIRTATDEKPANRFETVADFMAAIELVVGPPDINLLEPRVVLCPKSGCPGGKWSNGTSRYFWGPKVVGPTDEPYCESCGSEYVRGCPGCRRPLPENIADLVVKEVKSAKDALEAHCSRCGTLLFRTPTCASCGSYLGKHDMDRDTNQAGCQKCRSTAYSSGYGGSTGYPTAAARPTPSGYSGADDDIPF